MEQVLPPETANAAGYESPRVRQFTIFLENKVGRLQMLIRSLEQGVGRIVALSIEESGDSALVRMIAAQPDFGRELLQTAGFPFCESELLVVELPKNRQPMLAVCSALLAAEINIHYAYPLLVRPAGPAMAPNTAEDITLGAQLLTKKGFTLLSQTDLAQLSNG